MRAIGKTGGHTRVSADAGGPQQRPSKFRTEPPSGPRSLLPQPALTARELNIQLCRGLSRLPFQEAWRRVTEHVLAGHPIDNHIASSLLKVCRGARAQPGADRCDEVMRLLAASGVRPNESTYASLVAAYGDFHRAGDAAIAFESALRGGVPLSAQGFCTIIGICQGQGHLQPQAARFLLEGVQRGVLDPALGHRAEANEIDLSAFACGGMLSAGMVAVLLRHHEAAGHIDGQTVFRVPAGDAGALRHIQAHCRRVLPLVPLSGAADCYGWPDRRRLGTPAPADAAAVDGDGRARAAQEPAATILPGLDAEALRAGIARMATATPVVALNGATMHVFLRALGERGDAEGLDRFIAHLADAGQSPTDETRAVLGNAYRACGGAHAADAHYWLNDHEPRFWDLFVEARRSPQ